MQFQGHRLVRVQVTIVIIFSLPGPARLPDPEGPDGRPAKARGRG